MSPRVSKTRSPATAKTKTRTTKRRSAKRTASTTKRTTPKRRYKRRTPKLLTGDYDVNDVGRKRAIAILSVLSGERPASEVIAEEKIPTETYYELEARGIYGMIEALIPGANREGRLKDLEHQVVALQRENRRLERLLAMTRQAVKHVPFVSKKAPVGQRRMRGWRRKPEIRDKQRAALKAREARKTARESELPRALSSSEALSSRTVMPASVTNPDTAPSSIEPTPAHSPTSRPASPAMSVGSKKMPQPGIASTPTPDGVDVP